MGLGAGHHGGGERGRHFGGGPGSGEVGQVRSAVVTEQMVVAGDQEEVVACDEVSGDDGGQRSAVPIITMLFEEREVAWL
ncbi:hypothetical protein AB0I95_21765 [Micromonospora sp. NPDC049751]|uniref:hypothetical protein n=1 Tax=Micromonospora sp. NPDC049751 TaxID=3154837 RepID=UPI0033D37BCC